MARRNRDDVPMSPPDYTEDGARKLGTGSHHHVAEFYGKGEAGHLRPWARERVLARIGNED